MPWVKLSDDWYEDERWDAVPALAQLLWVRCLAWANRNRSRGKVTRGAARALSADMGAEWTELVAALVAAGSWIEADPGWVIHNYDRYQSPAVAVSEARRAAGRLGGQASAEKRRSTQANEANASPLLNPVTRIPYPETTTPSPAGGPGTAERPPSVELSTVLIMLVDRAEAAEPGKIRNRAAWRDRVLERVALQDSTRIVEILSAHPEWTAEQIANEVERRPAPVSPAAVPAPFVAPPPEVSRAEFEGAAAVAPERIAGLKASLSPLRAVPDA